MPEIAKRRLYLRICTPGRELRHVPVATAMHGLCAAVVDLLHYTVVKTVANRWRCRPVALAASRPAWCTGHFV
jgi:hypothetical protein